MTVPKLLTDEQLRSWSERGIVDGVGHDLSSRRLAADLLRARDLLRQGRSLFDEYDEDAWWFDDVRAFLDGKEGA